MCLYVKSYGETRDASGEQGKDDQRQGIEIDLKGGQPGNKIESLFQMLVVNPLPDVFNRPPGTKTNHTLTETDIFFHYIRIIVDAVFQFGPVGLDFLQQLRLRPHHLDRLTTHGVQKGFATALTNGIGDRTPHLPDAVAVATAGNDPVQVEPQQGTFQVPALKVLRIDHLHTIGHSEQTVQL